MDITYDRRSFLRRAALAALGAPAVSALGCSPDGPGRLAAPPMEEAARRTLVRPILLPWGPDAVQIAAPLAERPVAYMSHRRMEVYVDWEFRDRLHYIFSAHISVSTGHWRIPFPGDTPRVPVQAGDPLREFEEVDMREWDASLEPTENDVRIVRGSPTHVSIDVSCTPLSGGGVWLNGGPWDLRRGGPPNDDLCREDLTEIGTGTRYADRDCARPIGSVRFVTWASLESSTLLGA
jgi:hypothetical protein